MQNRRGLIFLGLAVVMGLAAAWVTTEFAPNSAEANIAPAATTPVATSYPECTDSAEVCNETAPRSRPGSPGSRTFCT